MDEVIMEAQIGVEGDGSMMQLDIEPFNDDENENDSDLPETNNNEVKGELDLVAAEGEANLEPYEGMELESEEAARAFYSVYARHVGFRIRISRYTRSRRDNSIISRLIVCSKEGFRESRGNDGVFGERKQQRQRAVTRVGCKAMLMVKKVASGKWVVSKFVKEHNHGPVPPRKVEARVVKKVASGKWVVSKFVKEHNHGPVPPRKVEARIVGKGEDLAVAEGGAVHEPFEGMEFDSEEDARTFYVNHARQMGFRARISKYCRSRRDNSIISRQIVCSKEGFREVRIKREETDDGRVKRPRVVTRIGCKAMIIVKKMNTGKWVVSRFEKEHNHALVTSKKMPRILQSSNDCAEKELVSYVGGDDVLSNAGMVMNSDYCDGSQGTSRESLTVLYNQLCYEAIKYAQEGAVSEQIYTVAMSALKEAVEKVAAAKRSAATVAQGVNGGHDSGITKCSNQVNKALAGSELLLMPQPVNFVLIPSTSLTNDLKPHNHSIESPMMLNIPNGQGISITNRLSILKQSSSTASSVKGLVGNGGAEHLGAAQDSQKLDNAGVSQEKTTPGNGDNLNSAGASEAQMLAFSALPVTLYMPVMGSLSESSLVPTPSTASGNPCTLVAAPLEASPVATGTQSQAAQQSSVPVKEQSSQTYTGPNPLVHATAIAAGARIIPPQEAASLIKAIEARVKSSKSAYSPGCKQLNGSAARSPWPCNSAEGAPKTLGSTPTCAEAEGTPKAVGSTPTHTEAVKGQEQASSEEMRLHEPRGFKEMEVAMMGHSAVYDSACEDHLFSDSGS